MTQIKSKISIFWHDINFHQVILKSVKLIHHLIHKIAISKQLRLLMNCREIPNSVRMNQNMIGHNVSAPLNELVDPLIYLLNSMVIKGFSVEIFECFEHCFFFYVVFVVI